MRRAKKHLAWLEEYGLTRTHRAQRIILRRIFEVGSRCDSIKYIFGVDAICAEVEAQTGYPIHDKMFFARHTLDGLMWKTGCKANLGSDGLMEVEFSK